jgi:hypothetical protein
MLSAVREKLFGMEFNNLGQLSQKLSLMSNQAYGFKKDARFGKQHDAVDIYNQFLDKADLVEDCDDEQDVAAAEIMWGKEPLTMNQRWVKQTKGIYDFDITKANKLFELLVKEGRIRLPEGHSMLRPDGVKEKRYCGFHDRNSHSINDCRVFRMRIQRAIQEGHLKFDNKMKLDGHPFPQNMVGFSVNMVTAEEKGKVKVLTSARARQDGTVDPERQVTLEQVHGEAPRVLKSHVEIGESSRASQAQGDHAYPSQQVAAPAGKRALPEAKTRGGETQGRRGSTHKRSGAIHARAGTRALGMCVLQALLERRVEAAHAEKLP